MGIRLPHALLEELSLDDGHEFIICTKDRTIILRPVSSKNRHSLESLLKDVTPSQVGGEFDLGHEAGAECYE